MNMHTENGTIRWNCAARSDNGDPCGTVQRLLHAGQGMAALRHFFGDEPADILNFVMFSTSGTNGTSTTIEDHETTDDLVVKDQGVSFLIIRPRIASMMYGNCIPETPEDYAFLKRLRQSSWDVMQAIGRA